MLTNSAIVSKTQIEMSEPEPDPETGSKGRGLVSDQKRWFETSPRLDQNPSLYHMGIKRAPPFSCFKKKKRRQ